MPDTNPAPNVAPRASQTAGTGTPARPHAVQLVHYAADPVHFDRSRVYVQGEPDVLRNPRGLWVSAQGEDDWPSWCRGKEVFTGRLRVAHRVTLVDRPNILLVRTRLGIRSLTASYAVQTDNERRPGRERPERRRWPIDWRRVADDFSGVVIAPFQGYCDVPDWYESWDCASGCIWDLSVVESFEPVVGLVDAR